MTRINIGLLLLLVASPILSQTKPGAAKTLPLHDIHIAKKGRARTGDAVITVNNKARRLSKNAYQVWPVMDGENALILISKADTELDTGAQLRFIDGDTKKHRDLGAVPFTKATLKEQPLPNDRMAFVLTGNNGQAPVIIVADPNTVHAQIDNATQTQITREALMYQPGKGGPAQTVALEALIGSDLRGIYEFKGGTSREVKYAQFEKDGSAYLVSAAGERHKGRWRTDGRTMTVTEGDEQAIDSRRYTLARADLLHVSGIPATTRLTVRLSHPLSSAKVKAGDPVDGLLISPPYFDGQIYLPQGTHFAGSITKAHSVGWAIPHETAALTIEFTSAKLEDGTSLPIHAHLYQVDNAREKVNAKGALEGVRSTGTLGHSAESKIASVAAVEPVAYFSQPYRQPASSASPSQRSYMTREQSC
jgi:hypothetical protein